MLARVLPLTLVALLGLAGPAGAATYVVRKGDTLSGVALRHGVSVAALAQANAIADSNRVVAGTRLQIPSAGTPSPPASTAAARPSGAPAERTHVVTAGESIERIARRYGVRVAELVKLNALRNPNRVVIGTRLRVPAEAAGASAGATTTTPPRGRLPARLVASPDRLALMPRFDHWARTYRVAPDLLKAVTWLESGWQNHVVSATGARGIGQLMPDTVAFVSRGLLRRPLDPKVPDHNIQMSARFLRYLLDQTGRAEMASAAYYQGLRSVRERGVFPGTTVYVNAVLALRPRFA